MAILLKKTRVLTRKNEVAHKKDMYVSDFCRDEVKKIKK